MGCVTACPSGVKYDVLIEETRARIEAVHDRGGLDALFRAFLFALFPYPARLQVALAAAFVYQRSGLKALVARSGLLAQAAGAPRAARGAPPRGRAASTSPPRSPP